LSDDGSIPPPQEISEMLPTVELPEAATGSLFRTPTAAGTQPPPQSTTPTPTRQPTPHTIPYFPRVLALHMHGRSMFPHMITEELVAAVGIAHPYLQDDVPQQSHPAAFDSQAQALVANASEAYRGTYIGVYGCGNAAPLISYMRAIFGDRILPRLVSAPLLAGEFVIPEAIGSRTHAATARIANRVIRQHMRLAERPDITCNITGAVSPQTGKLDSGIVAACQVPSANTLAGQEEWRQSTAQQGLVQPAVAAPGTSGTLKPVTTANHSLTILLVLRGRHRRIHNTPDLYNGLLALQTRMQEEHGVATNLLVHSEVQPELLDPVTSLKLFHQADVVVAVHGEFYGWRHSLATAAGPCYSISFWRRCHTPGFCFVVRRCWLVAHSGKPPRHPCVRVHARPD
jgi:hypothetical protein